MFVDVIDEKFWILGNFPFDFGKACPIFPQLDFSTKVRIFNPVANPIIYMSRTLNR